MLITIVLFFIFAIPVVFAIQPLLGPAVSMPHETEHSLDSLKRKKQLLYRQIKELELEYGLGLIPENEFAQLRQELKMRVSDVMEKMRKHS